MKTRLFVLAILCVLIMSSDAIAEWELEFEETEYIIYVDRSTIQRSGNIATMWTLWDYKAPQSKGGVKYLSKRQQIEFDCQKETYAIRYLAVHEGHMAQGNWRDSGNLPMDWRPLAPGSSGSRGWKIACGKQ